MPAPCQNKSETRHCRQNHCFVGTCGHAEIGLKRNALIKFSHFITLAPCTNKPETRYRPQNQRFFTMLSTNKTFFIGVDGSKSARNVKLSSKSAILSISQPFKTGLKHDAVDKNNVFSWFCDGSKSAWNAKLSPNSAILSIFAASQNRPETRCCRQNMCFLILFLLVQSRLKHEALVEKWRFSAPQSCMTTAFLNSAG